MDWVTSSAQWVMSLVPWWVYAFFAVFFYFTLRVKLGEKVALVYVIAAVYFVTLDIGGDVRERWVRQQWHEQAVRAKELAKKIDDEAAADKGADLQTLLDRERAARKEMLNALADDGNCGNADALLERLQPK